MQIRFSDVWVSMFELSMGHAAPPTHCPSHQLQITAQGPSRHLLSPIHNPAPGGGALSQGADGARGSAGLRASEHPRLHLQSGRSSAGERLLCRGEGESRSGLCCCLGCLGRFCLDQGNVASRVSVLMAWCAGNHFTIRSLSSVHHRHNHPHHREPEVIPIDVIRVVLKLSRTTARASSFRVLMWMILSMFDGRHTVYRCLRDAQSICMPNPHQA